MKKNILLLLFVFISCNMFGQDWLSLFIGSANKYASVELSDYRKHLCAEYNVPGASLDNYYRSCGKNWGHVGLALEIAKTSGRSMRDVCDCYNRHHRHGWDRILLEMGIRPGSSHYNSFCDRVHSNHNYWNEHYDSYCKHHGHHHNNHHHDKHHHHNNGHHYDHDKHHR